MAEKTNKQRIEALEVAIEQLAHDDALSALREVVGNLRRDHDELAGNVKNDVMNQLALAHQDIGFLKGKTGNGSGDAPVIRELVHGLADAKRDIKALEKAHNNTVDVLFNIECIARKKPQPTPASMDPKVITFQEFLDKICEEPPKPMPDSIDAMSDEEVVEAYLGDMRKFFDAPEGKTLVSLVRQLLKARK